MKMKSYEFSYGIIGFLGLMLIPITIWKCGWCVPDSFSLSYFLGNRDPFEVILGGLGIIFISNRGFDKTDHVINIWSGLSALGVISFPCLIYPILHYISAISLFTTFFIMCVFIFTQERSIGSKKNKEIRNRIYRSCGLGIISGFAILPFHKFYSEVIMIVSFSIAYLIQSKIYKK